MKDGLKLSGLQKTGDQTRQLLAFGTALDESSHAGFAAGEVCLAATAFDDLVVLLTQDEPTLFVNYCCLIQKYFLFYIPIM